MSDGDNPYRAPETSIAAMRDEVRSPLVYIAISLFCWIVGSFHLLVSIAFIIALAQRGLRLGWQRLLIAVNSPRVILILVLPFLGTAAYLVAGRLLWVGRARPGLILCGAAIGMTYLAVWLLTWR